MKASSRRSVLKHALAAGSTALTMPALSLSALAQSGDKFPSRRVTLVNSFSAGSISDAMARLIANSLQDQLGQPFVVENKVGAGGLVAAQFVARAAPDGYTLLSTASSLFSGAALYKNLTVDPLKDFTHIARIGSFPSFIAVRADLPIKTIQDLVTYAKRQGGKTTFGFGNNMGRMVADIFRLRTGAPVVSVPYRSSPASMTDLIAGQIDVVAVDMGTAQPHVLSGKARPLAVFTKTRSKTYPDVPTLDETVMPGFEVLPWGGVSGPANMPKDVIATLEQAVLKTLSDPKLEKQFTTSGIEVFQGGHGEFTEYVRAQLANWTALIKEAGIPPE